MLSYSSCFRGRVKSCLCSRMKILLIQTIHLNCPCLGTGPRTKLGYFLLIISIQEHNLDCQMQYQTCECGERILANELPTKLLTHWQHQQQVCLYSYIGCVSIRIFENLSFKLVNQMLDLVQEIFWTSLVFSKFRFV